MRRLLAWNIMTLDGLFEGTKPWDLSMHELVWGEELQQLSREQHADAGLLLFGRRTYEGMASYWRGETGEIADDMNSLPKAVISNTLEVADWNNTRLIAGDGVEQVRALKAEVGKNIYVFGSAELLGSLLAAGLVDEYRVCISPVILGEGTPLFKPATGKVRFDLAEARPLSNGGVLLRYLPRAA